MITWEILSKHLESFGLLKDFDWTGCTMKKQKMNTMII